MILKRIAVLLVCTNILVVARSRAVEPLRVGIDVKEPKLLKKVEIDYPEDAKIRRKFSPNVLKIQVDESGNVTQIRPLLFESITIDATIAALKQWRFAPSYRNNLAVSVTANIIVLFDLGRTPSYPFFFEDSTAQAAGVAVGPTTPPDLAKMSSDGNLQYIHKNPDSTGSVVIFPEPKVPFSVVEQKLKIGWPEYRSMQLLSSEYRYTNRLHYSVLLTKDDSQLIQLAGADPLVQPPVLDLDFDKISKQTPQPANHAKGTFYTLFVDEKGTILGVETGNGTGRESEIVRLLSGTRVNKPGMRNGAPVPTAVIIAVPVQ